MGKAKVKVFQLGQKNGFKKLKRTKEAQAVIDMCKDDFGAASIHSKAGCRKCWGKGVLEYNYPMGKIQKANGEMEKLSVRHFELCGCVEKHIDRMMQDV